MFNTVCLTYSCCISILVLGYEIYGPKSRFELYWVYPVELNQIPVPNVGPIPPFFSFLGPSSFDHFPGPGEIYNPQGYHFFGIWSENPQNVGCVTKIANGYPIIQLHSVFDC